MTLINEYYDVRVFEGTFDELTGLVNFKMDPYYELLRLSRKNKNRTTNVPIYVMDITKLMKSLKRLIRI